jgi:chromosome segregation ATPase
VKDQKRELAEKKGSLDEALKEKSTQMKEKESEANAHAEEIERYGDQARKAKMDMKKYQGQLVSKDQKVNQLKQEKR